MLRPIPARMLKSIGDTLRPELYEAAVLDLYAGQGRFAEMAIKESCLKVDLVEKDSKQARKLKSDFEKHTHAKVYQMAVEDFLIHSNEKYPIIFADPPFSGLTLDSLKSLSEMTQKLQEKDAIFVVKHPTQMLTSGQFPQTGLAGYLYWKHSSVGDATVSYFRLQR